MLKLFSFLSRIFLLAYEEISYRLPWGYALPPRLITIFPTFRCNLRCQMCCVSKQANKPDSGGELTPQEIMGVIDQIGKRAMFTHIEVSGGEPLLRKDILEILRYIVIKNASHSLLTNGTLLTDEVCKELVDMGWRSISVSIDGPHAIHDKIRGVNGSYKKVTEGIKKLNKYKELANKRYPIVSNATAILKTNLEYLHEIIDICADLGIKHCGFIIFNLSFASGSKYGVDIADKEKDYALSEMHSFTEEDLKTLQEELERMKSEANRNNIKTSFIPKIQIKDIIDYYATKLSLDECTCRVPWSMTSISPYGVVYPCLSYRIGNIREHKLYDLWNNKRYRDFRKDLKKNGLPLACIGCCNMRKKKKISIRQTLVKIRSQKND